MFTELRNNKGYLPVRRKQLAVLRGLGGLFGRLMQSHTPALPFNLLSFYCTGARYCAVIAVNNRIVLSKIKQQANERSIRTPSLSCRCWILRKWIVGAVQQLLFMAITVLNRDIQLIKGHINIMLTETDHNAV